VGQSALVQDLSENVDHRSSEWTERNVTVSTTSAAEDEKEFTQNYKKSLRNVSAADCNGRSALSWGSLPQNRNPAHSKNKLTWSKKYLILARNFLH
jgi:hypothetical protein